MGWTQIRSERGLSEVRSLDNNCAMGELRCGRCVDQAIEPDAQFAQRTLRIVIGVPLVPMAGVRECSAQEECGGCDQPPARSAS